MTACASGEFDHLFSPQGWHDAPSAGMMDRGPVVGRASGDLSPIFLGGQHEH